MNETTPQKHKRREFAAPAGKKATIQEWREGHIKTALAAIALHGGHISNQRLAGIVGVSPRGLRRIIEACPYIKVEIRGDKGRMQPWYTLNIAALPAPEPVPPMLEYRADIEDDTATDDM